VLIYADSISPSLIRASGGSPTRPNGLSLDPSSFIGTAPAGALSIFAPPLSADLPEALQGVISPPRPTASSSALPENSLNGNGHSANGNGNGSGGRELRVRLTIPSTASSTNGNGNGEATGDSLIKEADEGLATVTGSASNRLRPTRGKDLTQRTGVSASGKGVRVGGGARVGASGPPTTVTRQKGAPGGDTVCPLSHYPASGGTLTSERTTKRGFMVLPPVQVRACKPSAKPSRPDRSLTVRNGPS
jgi:hypothetical protein